MKPERNVDLVEEIQDIYQNHQGIFIHIMWAEQGILDPLPIVRQILLIG